MLILQRKIGQSIRISDNIVVTLASIDGSRVRLSIEAPPEIPIVRSELLETITANQEAAVNDASAEELLQLLHPKKD